MFDWAAKWTIFKGKVDYKRTKHSFISNLFTKSWKKISIESFLCTVFAVPEWNVQNEIRFLSSKV